MWWRLHQKDGHLRQDCGTFKSEQKRDLEDGGIMPNPTVEKLYEGISIARDNQVYFILDMEGGYKALHRKK